MTPAEAQTSAVPSPARSHRPDLVFVDTDVGDDIDDAFALALALSSPELRIIGITTTFGDTALRAQLVRRLLAETGNASIPVAPGPTSPATNVFTQRAYARRGPHAPPREAADGSAAQALFAAQVRAHPHEVTLITLGPLTTVEFLLDHDPASFGLLRRVVSMGGSIDIGYTKPIAGPGDRGPAPAEPEWNIVNGITGAQKLLRSGVPWTLLPLDSTQIPLEAQPRQAIFAHGSAITDALTLLFHQWGGRTPVLYDPLTVAAVLDPALCPAEPMRLKIDDKGFTRREIGAPNATVCLHSDREAFLRLLQSRLTTDPGTP